MLIVYWFYKLFVHAKIKIFDSTVLCKIMLNKKKPKNRKI